jgi:hypothetical protein
MGTHNRLENGCGAWVALCAHLTHTNTGHLAVPWLRSLVAGLSPRRPWFTPGSIHVGFVVDKAALGQVFVRVLRFSRVNVSFHRRSPNSYHLVNS